jgi:iron(III) transport system substrate-binding protein
LKRLLYIFSCLLLLALSLSGCKRGNQSGTGQRVVLYCSVDEVYAKPVIKRLEEQTGLRIDALYDTEAAKTAGLANRIRAEKSRPRGDVFWSSALLQTLLLQREKLLQEYVSPSARYILPQFKDSTGAWTGLGVRARVIVYHQSVANPPRTLQDLLQPRFKGEVGISNPQFGTGSDWVAALGTRQGTDKTLDYFRALKRNGVRVLPGNSVVADKVSRGELLAGVTDTDDFFATQKKPGSGIRIVNDSPQPAINTVLVPGSVAVLKGAPNMKAAQQLVDALLDLHTEDELVRVMPGVQSTRREPASNGAFNFHMEAAPGDTREWPDTWQKMRDPLADILLRN